MSRLIVLIGPSGAGKDTVLRWIAAHPERFPGLDVARRTISRADADSHEDHEGVDAKGFARLLEQDVFALHWTAHGLDYGVRHAQLAGLTRGRHVLLNGSRAHLPRARGLYPTLLVARITTSPEVLRDRLLARGREDAATIEQRLLRNALFDDAPIAPDLELRNDGTPEQAALELLDSLARRLSRVGRGA